MKKTAVAAITAISAFLFTYYFVGVLLKDRIAPEINLAKNPPASVEKSSATAKMKIYQEADYAVKVEVWNFVKRPFQNEMSPIPVTFGSGSVVRCEKYGFCVLTAWHVAENPLNTFYVHFKDGSYPQKMEVINSSRNYDFAVLRFSSSTYKPNKAAVIGKSSSLKAGAEIFAIGSNMMGDFWFSANGYLYKESGPLPRLAQLRFKAVGLPIYSAVMFIKADIFRGYSGGPLLNSKGELVGIAVALIPLSEIEQPVAVGIPIDEIVEEAKKMGINIF